MIYEKRKKDNRNFIKTDNGNLNSFNSYKFGAFMGVTMDKVYLSWLGEVLSSRPKNSYLIESSRGKEVEKLCLEIEKESFNWRRSDEDTFWVDVQLFIKYKLSNEEIKFVCNQQPGIKNYKKHSKERNAYAEMMRGMEKLRKFIKT